MKTARLSAAWALIALVLSACSPRPAARLPDPSTVTAHSEGLVSAHGDISVVLARARDAATLAGANPFRFDPPIKGSVLWSEDGSRADFRPETALKPGASYHAVFDFAALGEPENGWFSFDISVARPSFSVRPGSLYAAWDGTLALDGLVSSDDAPSMADLERTVRASLGGKDLSLSWSHEGNGRHAFTVKAIPRGADAGELVLSWNGAVLGAAEKGSERFRVPAEGAFEVLSVRGPKGTEDSAITVSFSQALAKDQDFRGLIRVAGAGDLRFEPEGGLVRVYASLRWPDSADVAVDRGLRSAGGGALAVPVSATVAFDWEKPELRFAPGGVIVPSSQGTRVVLETRNLAKVYVEALRVYGDNMLQFLQVNELDGARELKRVGEVVWRQEIDLSWTDDKKNQWVPYALDLSPLLAKHPDGLFQLRVAFSHDHIRYVCPNDHPDSSTWTFPPASIKDDTGDDSYWEYYEEWFDWDEYYRYRDDPCHPAFYAVRYGRDRSARRNVLVSDVGIIARKDSAGVWHVAASDLRSARPLPAASVTMYSYAMKQIAAANANADGLATLKPSNAAFDAEPAFMVVTAARATGGSGIGYLKLQPAQQLAVSHFDIGGEKAESGVKGFLYGERGVWRPGDDIHLTFILYDRLKTLPPDYPLSFELENPLGQVVRQATYTSSVGGFYYIKTGTEASSPTGTWTARVRVGGKTFAKTVKIETVMPNRLKLALDYGGAPYVAADLRRMGVSATWLHGAPAPGLKADVSMVLSASGTPPGDYAGFSFVDPLRAAPSERTVLFDGYLDAQGKASFAVDLAPESEAPGPLVASFMTRAFERSGLFSTEQFSVAFHPYARYVGVKLPSGDASRGMLLTDKDHPVEILLVDRDGKPVPDGIVSVSLYKLEWRWWWEKGEESLAEHASDVYSQKISTERVSVKGGRASWKLRVAYPNWGRYLIRVEDATGGAAQHAAGSIFYIDWPGWAGRGRGEGGGSAVMLTLSADKERYAVGETINVSFPSNKEGRAFICVERAGAVLEERWVDTKDGTTTIALGAAAAMVPNAYVHVSFVQPHLQTANDLPIRLYGVIPIVVENPATKLEPVITAPSSLEPNKKAVVTVSERAGRAMTYTLAVVDEGLLGITRYVTPNPWNEFYKKEASLLTTFDMYKDVAGAYTGKLQTLISIGGSEFGDGGGQRKPSRFPPVVRYFGPFLLSKGEKKAHEVELGAYVGAVRFMVVAGTPEGAYGKAEVETPVRAELMPFITAPRVLGPGERVFIPVAVFGFMGKEAKGSVKLSVEGPASVIGEQSKALYWPEEGEQSVSFELVVREETGSLRLVAEAAGPGGRTARQVVDIAVRSAAVPVTTVRSELLPGKGSATVSTDLPGLAGSNEAWLELSLLPPIDLSSRLSYLIGYPHGCGEQTTSKAFPQLFLADAVSLTPAQLEETRANVAAAITKLAGFQTARGGFVFWPGEYTENSWLTAYILHFYVMAKRLGYTVPASVLENGLAYLKQQAGAWSGQQDYLRAEQAYRLYVLALAGSPDIASMNRFLEYGPHQTAALYQLAAAFALSGMRERANAVLKGATAEVKPYAGMDYVYGSVLRDRAIVLDTFNALGDTAKGLPLFKQIADSLSSPGSYWSTQELSYALIACLPYMKASAAGTGTVRYAYDKGEGSVSIGKAIARIPLVVSSGAFSVKLVNEGTAGVYARVVARGTPKPGLERSRADGLALTVRYLDGAEASVDPDRVPLGQDLIVEIGVRNSSGMAVSDLALTFRAPSGWEIANMRLGRTGEEAGSSAMSAFTYQDIRDDRIMTYFNLDRNETRRYRLYMNKTYDGEFFLPAILAEAMYKPELFASIPGRRLSRPGAAPTASGAGGPNARNQQP